MIKPNYGYVLLKQVEQKSTGGFNIVVQDSANILDCEVLAIGETGNTDNQPHYKVKDIVLLNKIQGLEYADGENGKVILAPFEAILGIK